MLISIIIPTKNRVEDLNKILNSVFIQIQNRKDVEIIVSDDGSNKENSSKNQKCCDEIGAYYIKHNTSTGQAGARNRGIRAAKGQWIAFMDDDVVPQNKWFSTLINEILKCNKKCVGIEGSVQPSGKGLLDTEVINNKGKLFLTANIIYRKETLLKAGCFDSRFVRYAEDQELSVRILREGNITFKPEIMVFHSSRKPNYLKKLLNAADDMKNYLDAEYLFYKKHSEHYHQYRYRDTFWSLLFDIILKYSLLTIKRIGLKRCMKEPFQTSALFLVNLLQQITAILLAPSYVIKKITEKPTEKFQSLIDINESLKLPGVSKVKPKILYRFPNFERLAKKFLKIKNYSFNIKIHKESVIKNPKFLIRVDDFFLKEEEAVFKICKTFKENNIPFLAGVTGKDLKNSNYDNIVTSIINSGGEIALHGINHYGKHGPFPSEILQLKRDDLKILAADKDWNNIKVFIPPFNAISFWQIEELSLKFPIICGGPETGRWTEYLSSPVKFKSGTLYIPSLPPFYGKSADIVNVLDKIKIDGLLSITLHMSWETVDNFASLNDLLSKISQHTISWQSLLNNQ